MPEALGNNAAFGRPSEIYYPGSTEDREYVIPGQREDDMGETSIHVKLVHRFLQMLLYFFESREDSFVSANMNLYYDEATPTRWIAPDILVAFGAGNHERSSYQVWKENVAPQVIFEVSSERTWKVDISEKLETYGALGVEEYYILDPEFEFLPAPMLAFHNQGGRLLTVAVNDDKISSPRLGLDIVRTGNNFRLFDSKKGEFLLTLSESEAKRREEVEDLKAEIARLRAQR